jgi:hypothetical protein
VLLLFIQPIRFPTDEPIIDELTMRLTSAWRRSPVADNWRFSTCSCICGHSAVRPAVFCRAGQ